MGKVLQILWCVTNTLQLLGKSITLAIPLPKMYCNTVMRATLMHSSKSLAVTLTTYVPFRDRYLLASVPNVAGIFCDGHHVLVCFVLHFLQVFHVPLDVVAVGQSPKQGIVFSSIMP